MPPFALILNFLVATSWPFCFTPIVICHVPPQGSSNCPSYAPADFSFSVAASFMAAMSIVGIAAMWNATTTCAPVTAAPSLPAIFTWRELFPLCGGSGLLVNAIRIDCPDAEAALAFCAAGVAAPEAACIWLSESMRKLAEVTIG